MRNLISFYAVLALICFILLGGQSGCNYMLEPRFFDLSSIPSDMASSVAQGDMALPPGCVDVGPGAFACRTLLNATKTPRMACLSVGLTLCQSAGAINFPFCQTVCGFFVAEPSVKLDTGGRPMCGQASAVEYRGVTGCGNSTMNYALPFGGCNGFQRLAPCYQRNSGLLCTGDTIDTVDNIDPQNGALCCR